MEQRLGDRLDDRLVGLGRGALDHEARRLAERGGHLPDEAGKALEGVLQRQHPQAEHRPLQLADQAVERRCWFFSATARLWDRRLPCARSRRMADGVLGDQQLAGQSEPACRCARHRPAASLPAPGAPACPAARASVSARPSRIRSIASIMAAASPATRLLCSGPSRSVVSSDRPDGATRWPRSGRPIRAGRRRLPSPARRASASAPREGRARWPTGR